MEKEIESSSGSFLKNKQIEDNSSLYKSIGLDQSSISVQDKSKSRRKRIFQWLLIMNVILLKIKFSEKYAQYTSSK